MTDLTRKKLHFQIAAMLSKFHFILNLILLFCGIGALGAGHGDATLWNVGFYSFLLFNITLLVTLAFSFPIRNENWKSKSLFYALLLLFLIYLGLSIWLVTPAGLAAV